MKRNLLAVCICIVVMLAIVFTAGIYFKDNLPSLAETEKENTVAGEYKENIFSSGESTSSEFDPSEPTSSENEEELIVYGTIKLTPTLEEVLLKASEDTIIPIEVQELSGVAKEEIYEKFIAQLDVINDAYMKYGWIFATKNQVNEFQCPENMAIVLDFVERKSDIVITKDNIDSFEEETLRVTVYLKEEGIEKLHQELVNADMETRRAAYKKFVASIINPILEYYNISSDDIESRGIFLSMFTAELSKETIKALLDDERVREIIKHANNPVSVYGGSY